MAIKIRKEEDVEVTEGELARYRRGWERACAYNTEPPTLEEYIKGQKRGIKALGLDQPKII